MKTDGAGGGYFEFKEPRTGRSTSTGKKRQEPNESVTSSKESEVARPTASFHLVDLKDYDTAEKTIPYIEVYHIFEKPKTVNAEAEQNLKKAEFKFMQTSKTVIYRTSVDSNLLQLKICLRNNQD